MILRCRKFRRSILAGVVFVLGASFVGSGLSEAQVRKLTLDQAVAIALKNNAEIKEQQAGVLGAQAKRDQADAGRYPQLDITGVVGPSPRARGDQIDSPDDQDSAAITGVFTRGFFSLVQPIFTFGEISGLRTAASSNVKVEEAKVDEKSNEVIVKVKEFYYGYLVARDLMSLVEEVKGELDSAIEKVKKLLKEDSDTVSEMDLFKLESFISTVESGMNEARKSAVLALGALKFAMGVPAEEKIELADEHILPDIRRVEALPFYQSSSAKLRPEYRQIREGLKALEALVDVEKSKYYPKFFVAAVSDLAVASNRDRLDNPFVVDPLQHNSAAIVGGFKWHFDFGITKGRVAEAQAEYQKVLHKKTFAQQGIPLQVKKAYEEVQEAAKNIEASQKSYTSAKKWLVASVANFDLGIGDPEEIFKALEQYAKTRAENYKQTFAYNLALAKLHQASGIALGNYR